MNIVLDWTGNFGSVAGIMVARSPFTLVCLVGHTFQAHIVEGSWSSLRPHLGYWTHMIVDLCLFSIKIHRKGVIIGQTFRFRNRVVAVHEEMLLC